MTALFSLLAAGPWGMSFVDLAILIIIVAGICAIVYVVLVKAMGVQIPSWFINILWIVLAVFVGIVAIKLIASM